jgi:3D (Asp-Asp-Asp) domain-containing protein
MKNLILLFFLLPKTLGKGDLLPSTVFHTETKTVVNVDVVTLTTYSPSVGQTDSTPNITASGFKIDTLNPKRHKIIAISRDLKKKWKFNQKVRIRKAGKYNGDYTVKDVMNKRYKNRIDILVGKDDEQVKLSNVQITAINDK